ncbi:abortive infection family protein [Salinarimonas rosea]|uniref:abortive infection family protein n=1 Tax=Salinarimonas rosea TaxID=552063 RepID=UPI000A06B18A|nr:abortive infection family protein [Salinarimonas rosea]
MPQEIPEDARAAKEIRDVLTSLGKIAHSLGPIRNAYGSGHGRGRNFRGLEPRHARLAIGAASTFVDFVLDRHMALFNWEQKDKDTTSNTPKKNDKAAK